MEDRARDVTVTVKVFALNIHNVRMYPCDPTMDTADHRIKVGLRRKEMFYLTTHSTHFI